MLHSSDAGPSIEVVRAIQQISRDMHMLMFYLRPMKMVAAQLITVSLCRADDDTRNLYSAVLLSRSARLCVVSRHYCMCASDAKHAGVSHGEGMKATATSVIGEFRNAVHTSSLLYTSVSVCK